MSKLEKNIEEKAIRLYKEGHKVQDIIKTLKIGNTTLYRILRRNKISTRISPFKDKTSQEKICHQCRKSFSKTDKESYKQFYIRRFCSRKCNSLSLTGIKRGIIPRSAFRKGNIPWNKGIPHLVGEKNPNWKPKVDTKCATCGKQIKLHPYRVKRVKANYCSRKCTILSQEMPQFNTEPERILKKELIKSGFKENEDFIHQYNFFNKFRCDFAFPKEKVIIEVQGDFWHANPIKYPHNPENPKGDLHPIQIKGLNRDKSKFAYIKKRGWRIFPIWEFDIRHNQNRKVIIEAINYFLSTKATNKLDLTSEFNEVAEGDLGGGEVQPSETVKSLLCSLTEGKTENAQSEFGGVRRRGRMLGSYINFFWILDFMKDLNEQKKYLKRWYDKTAKRYDIWDSKEKLVSEGYEQEMGGIKKLLKVKKGDIVLDVATGTGNYLILMAQKGAICYGIDISPKILEIAKKKVEKLNLKNVKELKIGDADKIPYSDKFFDWINCIGMFEYYPIKHVKKIFLEFRRVLKNKGKIVVDFPDINNPEAHRFKKKSESVKTKVYLYNFKTIEKLIKDLGLKLLKKQISGFEIQLLLQPE